MTLRKFKKIKSNDVIINQLQDEMDSILSDVVANPDLDSHIINDIKLSAGVPVQVDHGLGRSIVGWFITRINADARVWETSTAVANRFVTLTSNANVTITIKVF